MFGVPQPLVEFFSVHDNFRLQTGTRVSIQHDASNTHWRLVIKNISKNDYHEYRAEARNVAGTVSSVASLDEPEQIKIEPPKILENLKNTKVKENNLIEMSVKVATTTPKNQPELEVEWFKNGVLIKPDNRMRIEIVKSDNFDEYKLVIQNALPCDAGEINVKVKNSAGSDSSNANLAIEVEELLPPKFTQLLKDVNLFEAENAILLISAIGNPAPEIEWLKNGFPINADSHHVIIKSETFQKTTTSTLTFTNVLLSDTGNYTCKAFNKIGNVETTSNFCVKELTEAPEFINCLKPIQINETENALFTIDVTGKPEPKIEWLLNEKVIEIDNIHFINNKEQNGRYTLLIKNAILNDSGSISCKATNNVGNAETKTRFDVLELIEKPKFVKELSPLEIKESESGIFSVAVTGKPKPILHWYKDNQPIQIDGEHFILNEETQNYFILTIKNSLLKDKGVISCQAINKYGIADTKTNFEVLEATEAPKFINGLEPFELKENQEGLLTVDVTGKPQPEILWFKDGYPVKIDNLHIFLKSEIFGHYTLIIKDVQLTDGGKYSCKAINIAGQAETTANFEIIEDIEAPHFTQELKPFDIKEAETATFTVKVTGKPEPSIEWLKNGNPIQINNENIIFNKESTGTYLLIIKKPSLEDAGVYSCKAINKAGKDETIANFGIIEDLQAPQFIEKLKELETSEGAQVVFECTVTGKPEPQIEWYRDDKIICVDNNHIYKKNDNLCQRLYINNAKFSDAGTYSCKAVNKAGSDVTLADLNFPRIVEEKVQEEQVKPIFIVPLETKTIYEGEEVNLQCKVNSNESHPTILWYCNDLPINLNFNENLTAIHSNDGTLTLKILKATKNEIGVYKCEAVNQTGKAETIAKVNYAEQLELNSNQHEPLLSFIRYLADEKVIMNKSIMLECQLDPICVTDAIKIDWFKDGVYLTSSKLEQLNSNVTKLTKGIQQFFINSAKFEHSGVFRCEASNTNNGNSVWTECCLHVLGNWERQNFAFLFIFINKHKLNTNILN